MQADLAIQIVRDEGEPGMVCAVMREGIVDIGLGHPHRAKQTFS